MKVETLGPISYLCPNEHCQWRVKSFYEKEPHTIKWLDALDGGLLWDIGANIGLYTLYAANKGCLVRAFEPESQNFAILNANIRYNHMNETVTAFPLCLGDEMKISTLNLSKFIAGGSCHNFHEEKNFREKPMNPDYRQGSIQVSGLDICMALGDRPTAIKIDVDGREPEVIGGLFYDSRPGDENVMGDLETLIVETNWNLNSHQEMVRYLIKQGFDYEEDQADDAKRKTGAFKNVGETIFTRQL